MKKSFILIAILFSYSLFAQDGVLDLTFGNNGMVSSVFPGRNFTVLGKGNSSILQPDDKIIVVGAVKNTQAPFQQDFAVARFNADGTLDNTFGTNGLVVTDMGSDDEIASAVALQGNGKIVVIGNRDTTFSGVFTTSNYEIIRYNTNGSIDNTFGTNGKIIGVSVDYISSTANNIAIKDDDRIIVVGTYGFYIDTTSIILRGFTADGNFDNTFGTNGISIIKNNSKGNDGNSIILKSDGSFFVVGSARNSNSEGISISKYTTAGILDSTFAQNGFEISNLYNGGNDEGECSFLQSNGGIIVGGYESGGSYLGELVRFLPNGKLDSSFATNGKYVFGANEEVNCVLGQFNGKILSAVNYQGSFKIQRFDSQGITDLSFGNSGKAYATYGSNYVRALNMAFQSSGKLIVVGSYNNISNNQDGISIARFNNSGALDVIGIKNDDNIKIFPNPVKTNIRIEGLEPNSTIVIRNILGTIVFKQEANTSSQIIDTSNLPSGIYLLNNLKFIKE